MSIQKTDLYTFNLLNQPFLTIINNYSLKIFIALFPHLINLIP